jgi:hypothetical protein
MEKTPLKIALSREDDIQIRGANHMVYDYNGKIVQLKSATIWYNDDGDYIEPKSYKLSDSCDILECLIM